MEAEEIYQERRSLGGYLAQVSTVINQVKPVLPRHVNARKFVKLRTTLSMHGLDVVTYIRVISLKTCLLRNLSELNGITVRSMTIILHM